MQLSVICHLPVNFVYHCTRLSSSKRHLLSGMKAIRHYCGVVLWLWSSVHRVQTDFLISLLWSSNEEKILRKGLVPEKRWKEMVQWHIAYLYSHLGGQLTYQRTGTNGSDWFTTQPTHLLISEDGWAQYSWRRHNSLCYDLCNYSEYDVVEMWTDVRLQRPVHVPAEVPDGT